MKKVQKLTQNFSERPRRKLSFLRVLIALTIISGLAYFSFGQLEEWEDNKMIGELKPWYAGYVDVTATPYYDFEQLGNTSMKNVILSFIVSSPSDACVPTWGNVHTIEEAGVKLDLDRRVARLRQLDGDVAVSFGGLLNDELAVNCTDQERLLQAYRSVIDRYQVSTIDFDIEGSAMDDKGSIMRRAVAIATLQKEIRSTDRSLAVWVTLPVLPQGLTEAGTNVVAGMLSNGVDLAGVNIMTMNYGQSKGGDHSMSVTSQQALQETHRQLGILYEQVGVSLNSASLWGKIGYTPMIGQNDIAEEVFTLDDADSLNIYSLSKGILRTSIWSVNRDVQCGENYANVSAVSDSCSGIKQEKMAFGNILSRGFDGSLNRNAAVVTEEDPEANEEVVDDPENSPYQIWSNDGVYLEGTKVVWKKNVYVAKWWTQGDSPDNPILQSWQTPWQLIGPVLPGEKPVPQPTLPGGTYPKWSGIQQYDAGERVLFNGIPYKTKWWTQGDSPAASISNPTSSPWQALTQSEIEEILRTLDSSKKNNLGDL